MESMASAGNEAFKEGFEKFNQGFTDLSAMGKETVETFVETTNAATKTMEAMNSEVMGYAKQSMEDSVAAAKAAMTSRSLQELIEVNTDYTKSAFDAYMGQMNKLSDMWVAAAKDTVEPFNEHVAAWTEKMQSYRP